MTTAMGDSGLSAVPTSIHLSGLAVKLRYADPRRRDGVRRRNGEFEIKLVLEQLVYVPRRRQDSCGQLDSMLPCPLPPAVQQ